MLEESNEAMNEIQSDCEITDFDSDEETDESLPDMELLEPIPRKVVWVCSEAKRATVEPLSVDWDA